MSRYNAHKEMIVMVAKALLNSSDISYSVHSTAGRYVAREELIFERMEKAYS